MVRPTPTSQGSGVTLSVLGGLLLVAATGFVDAHVYVEHGHVFAQAMTGNLIIGGVGLLAPQVASPWPPLAGFGAFLVGVAALASFGKGSVLAQAVTLLVGSGALTTVAFLPVGVPQTVIVVALAFAAGMQVAAFRVVGHAAFTTTVMTSNSRAAVFAVIQAFTVRGREEIRIALTYVVALVGFVAGAAVGAGVTLWLHHRAALVPAAAMVIILFVWVVPGMRRPGVGGSGGG